MNAIRTQATGVRAASQLLLIMADKVSFKVPPNLSRFTFNIARHHILLHGRGATVPLAENKRMKVLPPQLDHFLAFITSSYLMQDLPFGEKTLKLSSNTEIKIANVGRTNIPEQIVQQYQSYCHETGFVQMSRSTLCRILIMSQLRVQRLLMNWWLSLRIWATMAKVSPGQKANVKS